MNQRRCHPTDIWVLLASGLCWISLILFVLFSDSFQGFVREVIRLFGKVL